MCMGRFFNALHTHRLITHVYEIAMNKYNFSEEVCFPI